MAGGGRILAVNALSTLTSYSCSTFQCCDFLLSPLMLQRLRQGQYIVTRADPGLAGYANLVIRTSPLASRPIPEARGEVLGTRLGLPHLQAFTWKKHDPGWAGYPVWQTGQPTSVGYLTYHVNASPGWEIYGQAGYPASM